ncbi:MAG: CoA-binding protein [Burkholderiaceae bacterium]
MSSAHDIQRILQRCRTLAVVGLSAEAHRPSYFAAKYMLEPGYRIVAVNPKYPSIHGPRCFPSLEAIDHPVDMVDVFRRPQDTPAIAEQAVAIGAKVLWLQLGVINEQARAIAAAGGLEVVQDRCVKIEHARFFGGLNYAGVNTGVISARRPLRTTPAA